MTHKSSSSVKNPVSDKTGNIYYVGIGASAGGLEALRPFVANLPHHANMTYIIAQHMSPDHRSLMVDILVRETKLKVEEARNNLLPKADTIYVAPPNTDITVVGNKLYLSKPHNTIGPKPSVDRFFMSLADDQEDKAIGIILSGTGSDGAHGIKAIKAAGGISIAQEPQSCKYDSMPNAAIRIGLADLVLPPHEIAVQLSSIVQRPRTSIEEDSDEENPPSTIRGLIRQIATHTGWDFTNYKDATISRQIMRRMAAKQIPSLNAYGEYIRQNHGELNELAGNFLICVTSFFRDPEAFEAMRRILRGMLHNKKTGDDIRIWVPGCATGEEVYSIAILLAEELGDNLDKYRIQIFATDMNTEAVQIARAAVYPEAALAAVDGALIKKYFIARDGLYYIDSSLKEMTLFAKQDLVQDPPFVRLDMVSCRNLLIYFKPELQDRVLKVFHYSLLRDGILFLGKSETIGKQVALFAEKDRKSKIYIKRDIATPMIGGFSRQGILGLRNIVNLPNKMPATHYSIGHDFLFDSFSPASILITAEGEILEVFGDCSPFTALKTGKADFNLFGLIKPPFRSELRAFAHRVLRSKETAFTGSVALQEDGKTQHYRMSVRAVGQNMPATSDLLMVCFERVDNPRAYIETTATSQDANAALRIVELEQEAILSRENLQTVIEELETANEELQSLNEEAQAANEELQASNEELETANEELQASNEELVTVNDELSSRTLELADANNDMENIQNSLQQGLLVVDIALSITRYNQKAMEFFVLPPHQRSSLVTVHTLFHMPELLERVSATIKNGVKNEYEFIMDGRFYLMRLTPYISGSMRSVEGAVLSFTDINEQKIIEEKLKLSATVFEYASEATLITDANNIIISVNAAFSRITGFPPEEVIGKSPKLLSSGKQPREFYRHMWEVLLSTGTWKGEIWNKRKNGEIYPEWLSINVLRDDDGNITRHIAVFSDITDTKKAQETIEFHANFDSLTKLPNRNLMSDRLDQLLLISRRNSLMFAVMMLDLDDFKSINDALGHQAGDELLMGVAKRIQDSLRSCDSVGRLGGDEFIVLIEGLSRAEDAILIANKIIEEVHQPINITGHELKTSVSIGVTLYPMDGDTPENLLKNADSAMYQAKHNGRNSFCFFTHKMQDEANRRHWIASELHSVLQKNQLELHYQPVIALDTLRIVGAEALLRWKHPTKGYIPPFDFICVAEQNGSIGKIGSWVLETGLRDFQDWPNQHGVQLSLAFNLSASQLVSNDNIQQLYSLLDRCDLVSQNTVIIEITESLKFTDRPEYMEVLKTLKSFGCKIAIDDFGTGYSSLSYLRRLPIDIVKIDQSFVQDITYDPTHKRMLRAILQMANVFDLTTIAEGVETEEQLAYLRTIGCPHAQGFLFSKALPQKEFIDFVRNFNKADNALK